MVSKVAAKDRGAKCDDAEIGLARSAPLPNADMNKNIILIIYLTGPKIPIATANSASGTASNLPHPRARGNRHGYSIMIDGPLV
jgi:hypothetical protein